MVATMPLVQVLLHRVVKTGQLKKCYRRFIDPNVTVVSYRRSCYRNLLQV